jgi:hypothetical protein
MPGLAKWRILYLAACRPRPDNGDEVRRLNATAFIIRRAAIHVLEVMP